MVPGEDGLGVGHQAQRSFPVAQKPGDLLLQGIRIAHLHGGFVRDERLGKGGKIFHVRTEENRFAGENWLDGVLSTARGQAFADKHNRGNGVPMLQLACGIKEKTFGRRSPGFASFAAQANVQSESLETVTNFAGTFHVSRRDDQSEGREMRPKALKDFAENLLFASVRASAKENWAVAVDLKGAEDFERKIGIQSHLGRIVFNAADGMNAVARNAEGQPAFHVLRLLDADRIETTKGGRDERTKTLEPRFGPLR